MLPRLLISSLLLLVPSVVLGPQTPAKASSAPIWEYKILRFEARQCDSDAVLLSALNNAGREGWDLVSNEPLSPVFPRDAEGTLLFKPAATGPGKLNNPQTADSFTGTISMKMAQSQPGGCRMLLKRQVP